MKNASTAPGAALITACATETGVNGTAGARMWRTESANRATPAPRSPATTPAHRSDGGRGPGPAPSGARRSSAVLTSRSRIGHATGKRGETSNPRSFLADEVSGPREGWEDRREGMANNGRKQRRDRWPGFDLGGGGAGSPNQDRGRRIRAAILLALGFLFIYFTLLRPLSGTREAEIAFSKFQSLVRQHAVTNVEVSDTQVTGDFTGRGGSFLAV